MTDAEVRNRFDSQREKDTPSRLYHYTDGAAALSLIGGGAAWLTDYRFMNDPTEIIRSLNFAADYMGTLHQKQADELGLPRTNDFKEAMESGTAYLNAKYNAPDPAFYSAEYLETNYGVRDIPNPFNIWGKEEMLRVKRYCVTSCFAERTAQDLKWLDYIRCYVMSFSEVGDALPQWRAYCQRGGYSLGFDMNDPPIRELSPQPCFYGSEEEHNAVMRPEVERFIDSCTNGNSYPHPNPLDPGQVATSAAEWRGSSGHYGTFAYRLVRIAALLKHQSFADEREWRVIILKPDHATMQTKHRSRANYLVPYIEQLLGDEGLSKVVEVTVGPFARADLALSGMNDFLATIDSSRVELKKTNTPYLPLD